MSGSNDVKNPTKATKTGSRDARLAAALRENLRRRKAQERGRGAEERGRGPQAGAGSDLPAADGGSGDENP